MPSPLVVTSDYDGHVWLGSVTGYDKVANIDDVLIGYVSVKEEEIKHRGFFRFSLADLPEGVTVTQVRRRVNCNLAGGESHLIDDHAYGTNGQEDPSADTAENCYNRCASGNLYKNDSTDLRTTGVKWATLGGSICTDVQNAKANNKPFALAIHEEGDDDPFAQVDGYTKSGGTPPQLEITYEEYVPVTYTYNLPMIRISMRPRGWFEKRIGNTMVGLRRPYIPYKPQEPAKAVVT